ncbi:TetR/AcrR family transcriptional regulator [Streptomyces katsurahamanus]|uniref:TetR/AcrR family transcriptional regulator n=1 Tax=Streptomyces katsurahamanus TaxID=2577098 RepID=A0ABW9NYQ9_9ACTN|nr:TetR/AcrR family transcriptional regulator [Streptomyces katsurahamanus]
MRRPVRDPPLGSGTVTDVQAPRSAPKSEQTRTLILETALRLFQEHGYDKTTMRAIAKEAGVSVGNAYYYFDSKASLITGFYDRMSHEHATVTGERLQGAEDFGERLEIAVMAWVDCAKPYHEFAAQFFSTAADPDSPLSPFSDESYPARAEVIQIFRDVLEGSQVGPKLDSEVAELLPDLLWLYLMGVVLYWVFDHTEDTERTRAFVRKCAPLVARAVRLSRFRVVRPLVRDAVELMQEFVIPKVRSGVTK